MRDGRKRRQQWLSEAFWTLRGRDSWVSDVIGGGAREENITDTGKYFRKCFEWDLMKTLESSHSSTAM